MAAIATTTAEPAPILDGLRVVAARAIVQVKDGRSALVRDLALAIFHRGRCDDALAKLRTDTAAFAARDEQLATAATETKDRTCIAALGAQMVAADPPAIGLSLSPAPRSIIRAPCC